MSNVATLSDWLFTSTIGVYMLAAFVYAAEYTLSRRPAHRSAPVSGVAVAERPLPTGKLARVGLSLTILGAGVHAASLLLRGVAAGRLPWGNMYEYMSSAGLVAVVTWLYIVWKYRPRQVAVFVILPVGLLLFIAGNSLYTEAAALQPALRSYWIAIHVTAAIMASGVFMVSGITSALHLISEHRVDNEKLTATRLPEPEFLDKLAYRSGVFGFVTLTFAIITGAVWAEGAWGRFWGWDPKETVAFVSWVCYAAYLHARATSGWRSKRAAWVNIAGLVVILFNLFFVNLVAVGLHSYAGVD
jgi:cytochrome c-type biogenesis protein CcsB